MTSRIRAASERVSKRAGSALSALALLAAVLTPVAPAHAQDGPSLIRDTEIEEILHRDADPIYAAAGLDPKTVRILLVGDKELNAFATQGLHDGPQHRPDPARPRRPNQLKGVIAHETGHLRRRPPAALRRDDARRPEAVAADHGPGRPGRPGRRAGRRRGPARQRQLFRHRWAPWATAASRKARADQAGAGFLDEPGPVGPRAWSSSSTTSATRRSSTEARRYAYFRSHPLSSRPDRGAAQPRREAAALQRRRRPRGRMAEHEIMKAKLDGFLNPQRGDRRSTRRSATGFPARYARAIAYYQMKEPDQALKLLDALLAEQPEQPLPVGAQGPGPVRVQPRHRGGRGAAAPVGGAEARRAAAARQPGPDPDRPGRSPRRSTRASASCKTAR